MDSIVELLVNGSPMAAFAIFLIYLYTTMQKRMDSLVERFQEQLEKIQTGQKEEITELRDRYDKVITTYNDERTQIRVNLAERIGKVGASIDNLPIETLQIQIEAVSLAQRNSHLLLEKGMEMMREQQDEAKLKAMAKKLSDKD